MISHEIFKELATVHTQPCLSLYQPTARHIPANAQDPIRFRNLVKTLAAMLSEAEPPSAVSELLAPFDALAADHEFWRHTLDGLAVLSAPGYFRAIALPRPVAELVVVAESFHVKPLWRFLQTVDRFQVLGLGYRDVRFFEGNRDRLDEVELNAAVPRTMDQALGSELTEPHTTVSSHGGLGVDASPMHHGSGGKADEMDADAMRFFRAVDRAVLAHYSRPSGLPLILATLPEHHHLFHRVSHNPFLLADGIRVHPSAVTREELRTLAWKTIEPQLSAQLDAVIEAFAAARARNLAGEDLAQLAEAAVAGRIETILIEANREIHGHLDNETGRIVRGPRGRAQSDDLLDDLGALVEKRGGSVRVLPAEKMPTQTGAAAIYRF